MIQEYKDKESGTGVRISIYAFILSFASLGSAGGAYFIPEEYRTLCFVASIVLVIVSVCYQYVNKNKKNGVVILDIIDKVCLAITIIVLTFGFLGKLSPESCGKQTSTPFLTPTPIQEIKNPSGKIAAGNDFSMLLRSDKKVVTYGRATGINTTNWENIIQISAYGTHAVGLCENGHVIVTAEDTSEYKVSNWYDIKQAVACEGGVIGVTNGGQVLFEGPNKSDIRECTQWTSVDRILAAAKHVIAVDKYGSILKAGDNEYHQLNFSLVGTVIAAAAANDSTFLVYQDKSVFPKGKPWGTEDDVSGWSDIVAVAGGDLFTVGLCSDGTLRLAGDESHNKRCVRDWENIIAVCAGQKHVVAIDQVGRVYSKGYDDNGRCGIDGENYWVNN